MGSGACITLEADLDAAGEPQELHEPAYQPWKEQFSQVFYAGRLLGLKVSAETGGWLALYIAGRLHSTMGLNTLKAMTDFVALEVPLADGEIVKFIAQADAGTGKVSCVTQFTEEGS